MEIYHIFVIGRPYHLFLLALVTALVSRPRERRQVSFSATKTLLLMLIGMPSVLNR